MNSGNYDDRFVDQLPRLLPIMSELDRKLAPLSRVIRKRYFRNVDLEREDQFRPKYVQVSPSVSIRLSRLSSFVCVFVFLLGSKSQRAPFNQ